MKKRTFTLEEATELLSWLESKFGQLGPVREALDQLQDEQVALMRQSRRNGGASLDVKIHETQTKVEEAGSQVAEIIKEIDDQGIIVRDVNMGLVDFPSFREEQEILLCWVRGEDTIQYWHGTNEGYMSRKPL